MLTVWTQDFRAVAQREHPNELHTGDLRWYVAAEVPQLGTHGGVDGTAVQVIAGPFVDEHTAETAVAALASLHPDLRATCKACGRMAAAHDPVDMMCAEDDEQAQAFLCETTLGEGC